MIAHRLQDVDFQNNRVFVRSAYVRGQLKNTKTKSGKREVTLQPQAKEALLNQKTFTGKTERNRFSRSAHQSAVEKRSTDPQKSLDSGTEKAGIKYRNPYQTRLTFASALLSRGKIPYGFRSRGGMKIGA